MIEHLHHQLFFFFFGIYKMVDIGSETWNKAGVAAIKIHKDDNVNKSIKLFLCISDTNKRSGGKNLYDLIDKDIKDKYGVKE